MLVAKVNDLVAMTSRDLDEIRRRPISSSPTGHSRAG